MSDRATYALVPAPPALVPRARAGVEGAARRARENRAALVGLGFAAGLAWAGAASAPQVLRRADAAARPAPRGPDPLALECARLADAARAHGLPACAASLREGFAAALAAVAGRIRDLDREAAPNGG